MPGPMVTKPPMRGAFKGKPLQKAQLSAQRANRATWKASQTTDPDKKSMFLSRAQKFAGRSQNFANRATKTPSTPTPSGATAPGSRTNPNLFKAQTNLKRGNPNAAKKWLNRSVGL